MIAQHLSPAADLVHFSCTNKAMYAMLFPLLDTVRLHWAQKHLGAAIINLQPLKHKLKPPVEIQELFGPEYAPVFHRLCHLAQKLQQALDAAKSSMRQIHIIIKLRNRMMAQVLLQQQQPLSGRGLKRRRGKHALFSYVQSKEFRQDATKHFQEVYHFIKHVLNYIQELLPQWNSSLIAMSDRIGNEVQAVH